MVRDSSKMKDSPPMFSSQLWDLAPGEDISQSPPSRVLHGSRTPLCPAPTLDTDEFIANNALSDDCSSLDSMAEFGLAPGEVRSQIPFRTFYGSQPQRCPPPTLDTEEFQNNFESEADWIVLDSQPAWDRARGERESQNPPSDLSNAPDHSGPPALDAREFENNRVISDLFWRVEDSLAGCDSAPGEDRQAGPDNQANNFKSLCFPPSVHVLGPSADKSEDKVVFQSNRTSVNCVIETGFNGTIESNAAGPLSSSAGKRSISHCSPQGETGNSKKQVKLDPGTNFSDEFKNLRLPVPFSGRPLCDEGDQKVSIPRATESPREPNLEVTELESSGPAVLSPPKHLPPTAVPPTISDMKPMVNNVENVVCQTPPATRLALLDVTNPKVSEVRSPTTLNSKERASGSLTKESADSSRNLRCEEVFSTSRRNLSEDHLVLASSVRIPAEDRVVPEKDEVILEKKTSRGVKRKSRKLRKLDLGRDPEGWLCPKGGKRVGPTSRQVCLDGFLS